MQRHAWRVVSYLSPIGCRIVNWVTTANGRVHTADTTQLDSTRQDLILNMFSFQIFVGSRRQSSWASCEFNTHRRRRRDADATQHDSWVASASAVCIGHNPDVKIQGALTHTFHALNIVAVTDLAELDYSLNAEVQKVATGVIYYVYLLKGYLLWKGLGAR